MIQSVPVDVLESLGDGLDDVVFFVKDEAARYVAVNRTLAERCGVPHKRDLLGRRAEEVFPGALGASFTAQDRQVLASGRPIESRLELHLYAAGRRGWCLTWKHPVVASEGRVVGLVGLSRDLPGADERHPDYTRLAAALETLTTRYAEPLRLAALASGCGLSMDRFERLVARVFHLTPRQLLAKVRVDAASRLLLETDSPIATIALQTGYGDQSAFTRQFRARVGLTPREFRRLAKP